MALYHGAIGDEIGFVGDEWSDAPWGLPWKLRPSRWHHRENELKDSPPSDAPPLKLQALNGRELDQVRGMLSDNHVLRDARPWAHAAGTYQRLLGSHRPELLATLVRNLWFARDPGQWCEDEQAMFEAARAKLGRRLPRAIAIDLAAAESWIDACLGSRPTLALPSLPTGLL